MILSLFLKSEPKKQSYDAAVVGFIPSHAWCSLALPLYMNLEALKDSLLLELGPAVPQESLESGYF